MRRMRWTTVAAGVLMALAAEGAMAQSGGSPPPAEVQARGNPFFDSGNLDFSPAAVTVQVGQVVRWTNTDPLVPHTSTEVHGLWDLGGTYGGTPANRSGYGPGESVSRPFEAGLHKYLCVIHPSMVGTVTVPVQVAAARRRVVRVLKVRVRVPGQRRKRTVRVRVVRTVSDVAMRWAAAPTGATVGFDVEVRRGDGGFKRFATGTREAVGSLVAQRPGTVFQVRARWRDLDEPAKATDWSPPVTITA